MPTILACRRLRQEDDDFKSWATFQDLVSRENKLGMGAYACELSRLGSCHTAIIRIVIIGSQPGLNLKILSQNKQTTIKKEGEKQVRRNKPKMLLIRSQMMWQ